MKLSTKLTKRKQSVTKLLTLITIKIGKFLTSRLGLSLKTLFSTPSAPSIIANCSLIYTPFVQNYFLESGNVGVFCQIIVFIVHKMRSWKSNGLNWA